MKRRVAYKQHVDRREEGAKFPHWVLEEVGEGDFLGWGMNYEELEGGAGMFTAAIIETGLGVVELVPAEQVRFLTRAEDPPSCPLAPAITRAHLGVEPGGMPAEAARYLRLSPSEALYGFTGWLTTRKTTTSLGAMHNCAGIPELVDAYCKANGLEEPREGWHKQHQHPEEAKP